MLSDTGTFETRFASRYLTQLCKHFAHKVEASFDDATGRVALGTGPVRVSADEVRLTVEVSAPDDKTLVEARDIIDRHLVRFAHREGFEALNWGGL